MEEEKLDIVSIEKYDKLIKKANSGKIMDLIASVMAAFCVCYWGYEAINNNFELKSVLWTIGMFIVYTWDLEGVKNYNKKLEENIAKKEELEEKINGR